jgi:hypothetical protein
VRRTLSFFFKIFCFSHHITYILYYFMDLKKVWVNVDRGMTPTRGPSTPTRGSREVFGNIGLNDQRAHSSQEFAAKPANKKLFFGNAASSKSQLIDKAALLVIHFQNAEIRRLQLQNAFMKLKYYPGLEKTRDHTTPKKRRYGYGASEEATVERLGGLTKNMFSSPTRVKSRDIPTTPPKSRQQAGIATRPKSAHPTPERHVLHAKLNFPHEPKHPSIPTLDGPASTNAPTTTSATNSTTAHGSHFSDGMIEDLSIRLRELERHIHSLSIGEPSTLEDHHTRSAKPKVAFEGVETNIHSQKQTSPSGKGDCGSNSVEHRLSGDDNTSARAIPPTSSFHVFTEHPSRPLHPSNPDQSTTTPLSKFPPHTPASYSTASSGDRGLSNISHTVEGDISSLAYVLLDHDCTHDTHTDLHDIVHRASSAALQTINFSRTQQQSAPDRFSERDRRAHGDMSYASPDETLAAIRRGLASPPHISPLGERGKGGIGTPKVALSDLPLLQSKLSTWRKLYSVPSPTSPADVGTSHMTVSQERRIL